MYNYNINRGEKMPKIRKKLRSNRIKLNIKKIMLLICILLTVFGIGVAQSKYKSSTLEQVITLITKYHVNYQTVEKYMSQKNSMLMCHKQV